MVASGLVFGRDPELAALERFVSATDGPASPRLFAIVGEPGMGKSTLWAAGVEAARSAGQRVLVARPAEAESRLSFVGLGDLFDGARILDGSEQRAIDALPVPQRHALEIALMRVKAVPAFEERAVGPAVLGVLRRLSDDGPLLVAIDDLPWLDAASVDALAFAARRLADEPVRFLVTRRTGNDDRFEQATQGIGFARLDLSPMSLGAIRRLIVDRFGLVLARRRLRAMYERSGGNPLYALELARVGGSVDETGEPVTTSAVTSAILEMLGVRVRSLNGTSRELLLAVALSAPARQTEIAAVTGVEVLSQAIEDGLLVSDGDRVRAWHPLLATVVISGADPSLRRRLHASLATVVRDVEARARHLALAAVDEDATLAEVVAAAAARAAGRGATDDALDLSQQALRLTPDPSPERGHRLMALAERLLSAGEHARARELLESAVVGLPRGPERARARLMLADARFQLTGVRDAGTGLDLALRESARDRRLHAVVLARRSRYYALGLVDRVRRAEADARLALSLAHDQWPDVELAALEALAWARHLRGRNIDDLRARFLELMQEPSDILRWVDRPAAERYMAEGRIGEARSILDRLLVLADARGEMWSFVIVQLEVVELELRCGAWERAAAALDEWAESPESEISEAAAYERCRALLAACRGDATEADRWADAALRHGEPRGLQWNRLEALRARGLAALLDGRHGQAAESLGTVWFENLRAGVEDPGIFPVAPELVEALLALGDRDTAGSVAARVRRFAATHDHPWARATARRCMALVAMGAAAHEAASAELSAAADELTALGLPFDAARTLLQLGSAERRLRKWGAARRSLEHAASRFDALGSTGWANRARGELARVGARRPAPSGSLTAAERQVAGLAADGLANKEIGHALSISLDTVEAHLSHAYAKLGVTSRTRLAKRLADPG